MRHAHAVLSLIHGIGHLSGFAAWWRLLTTPDLYYRTSILHGHLDLGSAGIRAWDMLWLALFVAFGVITVGIWSRSSWCFED